MSRELTVTAERIDDFPLLLSVMLRLGLPGIFDRHHGRHGLHQGLSWGWIATIWLAHILTESNHRKQPVQAWVQQARETILRISGQQVNELDFTNDRLTLLLRCLSKPVTWQAVERELGQSILRVYALTPKNVRFLKIHNVEGLLPYTFERQEKRQSKYLGRGRSTPDRPKQKVVTVRFQITAVVRQEDILAAQQKTLGWRAAAIGFARLPF